MDDLGDIRFPPLRGAADRDGDGWFDRLLVKEDEPGGLAVTAGIVPGVPSGRIAGAAQAG